MQECRGVGVLRVVLWDAGMDARACGRSIRCSRIDRAWCGRYVIGRGVIRDVLGAVMPMRGDWCFRAGAALWLCPVESPRGRSNRRRITVRTHPTGRPVNFEFFEALQNEFKARRASHRRCAVRLAYNAPRVTIDSVLRSEPAVVTSVWASVLGRAWRVALCACRLRAEAPRRCRPRFDVRPRARVRRRRRTRASRRIR